jgi:hypothetical protein
MKFRDICMMVTVGGFGCGNSGSGAVDSPVAIDAANDASVVDAPVGNATVMVRHGATPVQAYGIVVNTADGSFVSQSQTGTDGKAVVSITGTAMVTAIVPGEAFTWTSARPGDTLDLDLDFGIAQSQQLGTVEVSVAALPLNSTFVALFAGCDDLGPDGSIADATLRTTIAIRSTCVGADGKLRIVAYAKDNLSDPVAVSVIEITAPAIGETSSITMPNWQTTGITEWRLQQTNRSSTQGYGSAKFIGWRQGASFPLEQKSANMPYTWVHPVSGFAELLSVDFMLPVGVSGTFGTAQRQYFGKIIAPPSASLATETVNLATDLLPLILSATTAATTDIARPTLQWTVEPTLALMPVANSAGALSPNRA